MRQFTFAGKYKKYVMGSVMFALFSLSLGSYACQETNLDCRTNDDCCSGYCTGKINGATGKCSQEKGCGANGTLCMSDSFCCEGYRCTMMGPNDPKGFCTKSVSQDLKSSGVNTKKKAQEAVGQRPLGNQTPDVNLPNKRY